ncbi:MAG: hypothetical protein IKR37_00925 [Paludibacteraceae bacterium]|nr:hypothetical protein [Paludibacteraceae bacterium]
MAKKFYIQPSVMTTEIWMPQTLCVSGESGGSQLGSAIDPEATTPIQL